MQCMASLVLRCRLLLGGLQQKASVLFELTSTLRCLFTAAVGVLDVQLLRWLQSRT